MPVPTVAVALHPLGIGLAAVFLGSLIFLFVWMFRVRPPLPQEVARARFSVSVMQRIVVPVSGNAPSMRAIELASRLGQSQRAEILPIYVLEVPLTLSLDTALPAQEARAQEVLNKARTLVQLHGLPVHTQVVRQRSVADGIIRIAEEEQADAIVVGLGWQRGIGRTDAATRTIDQLLRRARCEVIIARYPAVEEIEEERQAA